MYSCFVLILFIMKIHHEKLVIQEAYTIAYKTECVCTKDFTLGHINLIFILNPFVFDTLVGLTYFY